MKEINPEVVKAFSENQYFQILLNSLPEAYTSLADSLMTSYATTDEKLQKLMDKEDTLTSTESGMAAYRKTFKASCYLCDGTHLVAQCPQLSKAQAYIKKELKMIRGKSRTRSKDRKSRRHHHRHGSSSSEASTSSESSDSESDKKKARSKSKAKSKSSVKKKDDKKESKHAHFASAISDTSDTSDSDDCLCKGYGAVSDTDDNSDEETVAYIAAAKKYGALKELLDCAKAIRTQSGGVSDKASGLSTIDTQSGGAQEEDMTEEEKPMGPSSALWDFDPVTHLLR